MKWKVVDTTMVGVMVAGSPEEVEVDLDRADAGNSQEDAMVGEDGVAGTLAGVVAAAVGAMVEEGGSKLKLEEVSIRSHHWAQSYLIYNNNIIINTI
jgi:hypothetical protein